MFGLFKKTSQEIISGSKKMLSDLIPGQRASIEFIDENCQGIERNRLLDLGFVPGAEVEVTISSAFNDPTAYLIKGGLIALRRTQARKIHISPIH